MSDNESMVTLDKMSYNYLFLFISSFTLGFLKGYFFNRTDAALNSI